MGLSILYCDNNHVFKSYNDCVVVCLEVVIQNGSLCMVALRAVEMLRTNKPGNSEKGLNINCSDTNKKVYHDQSIKMYHKNVLIQNFTFSTSQHQNYGKPNR